MKLTDEDNILETGIDIIAQPTGKKLLNIEQLSGGEKQRVQLARVLAQLWSGDSLEGKLLLLDEPTTALDLTHQQMIFDTVRQLAARGCTVLLVIHEFNLVSSIADDLLVLNHGRVHSRGAPREVFTAALFREIFAVDVIVQDHPTHRYPLVIPA